MGTLPQRRSTRKPGGDRRRSARSIVRAILFATTVVSLAWVVGFLGVFLWRHRETDHEDARGGVSSMMRHAVSSGIDRRTLEKGGTHAAYGSPLLIFTCRRDSYLSETLEHVYASIGRPCRFGCPIIVSEDGRHPEIEKVVLGYRPKFEALGIPLLHIRHDQRLRGSDQKGAYQALARHYGWALAQVFNGKVDEKYSVPQRVVILEEDIRVAPDFFSYMEAASGLLDSDPTLFAVSAFNDNGHQVRDPKRLLRSDFFPGLGWMMTRELWKAELESKWPSGYWDDWLRDPEQRKGRQVIRPEISRTFHFGTKGGASSNQFGNIIEEVKLNDQPVRWENEDLSYLESSTYEKKYLALVMSSTLASTLGEARDLSKTGNVRLGYENFAEFHDLAKSLGIMDDEKAMIPRTAYKGIVETRPFNDNLLFLYPKNG